MPPSSLLARVPRSRAVTPWLIASALAAGCDGDPATLPDAAIADAPSADGPPADSPDGPGGGGDPLIGVGTVERVQGGFMFTEGPQWRDTEGDLVFTDIPANTIYQYVPGPGAATVLTRPSANANGLAVDAAGMLYAARHGARDVTRAGVAIASTFEGDRLNSPNDVVVADDGTVYFTDPPYGIQPPAAELDFMGVFRLSPSNVLTAEHRGPLSARPNGIGLSPDGTTLYVADTADGEVYRFPVGPDGALGTRTVHASTAGGADGLAIDEDGNVFVTSTAGVEVFSSTGEAWGTIDVPEQPSNCAFGDADHRTLYITARTSLYRVRLANPGLPRR
jgi:gluconolactonase